MKKNAIAAAVLMAVSGGASAAAITSFTISDVWDAQATALPDYFNTVGGVLGTDGSSGRFGFNVATYKPLDRGYRYRYVVGGANQGPGVFTTGFIFATNPFKPMTDFSATPFPSGGAVGDITGGVLSITNLDFGGLYAGTSPFYLAPDSGSLKTNFIQDIGGGDFAVAFSFTHLITSAEDPSFTYVGQNAHWVIEGVAHTGSSAVPVPAAGWLMGSGLLGLAGIARRKKASST